MANMETDTQGASAGPRRFRIWVAGQLDERFVDGAAEIELMRSTCGSTLEGPFVDQSQLRGILDRLWRLGIEVVKFETCRPAATDRDEGAPPAVAERPTDHDDKRI